MRLYSVWYAFYSVILFNKFQLFRHISLAEIKNDKEMIRMMELFGHINHENRLFALDFIQIGAMYEMSVLLNVQSLHNIYFQTRVAWN